MGKYLVRVEKVRYAEIDVDAGSALLARHAVMQMLDDGTLKLPDFRLVTNTSVRENSWQDGGINVELAREICIMAGCTLSSHGHNK